MIKLDKKSKCNGCYGCANICPQNCINMERDNEGFDYPVIDVARCTNCGLCEKVCINLSIPVPSKFEVKAYACKNKDDEVRLSSSSGGFFSLLCEEVIENGGVVFGASLDSNQMVHHSYAESIEGCIKFRGSKYVQSKLGDSYKQVKNFLDENRRILFTGTPCQVVGLNNYLMKKYDNLILVDIACHGAPSPLVYEKYLESLELKNKSKIASVNFRDKSTGWKGYSFSINFEDGQQFKEYGYSNIYMKGFLSDLILRPSCYECNFKKPITCADITLCDYWGVEGIHEEFYDDIGVSLILINSSIGQNIFEKLSKYIDYLESDINHGIICNPSIVNRAVAHKNRNKFFKLLGSEHVEDLIIKFTRPSYLEKLKFRVKRFF